MFTGDSPPHFRRWNSVAHYVILKADIDLLNLIQVGITLSKLSSETQKSHTEPMATEELAGSGYVPTGEERWSDGGTVVAEYGGAGLPLWDFLLLLMVIFKKIRIPFGGDKPGGCL
ncbi:hypothetical protein U1Q18_023466 [Sarracenia purpurea var. burkii]